MPLFPQRTDEGFAEMPGTAGDENFHSADSTVATRLNLAVAALGAMRARAAEPSTADTGRVGRHACPMNDELKRLLGCVGKLEPERQRLVLLAYYNGWSREQLAEKFDTPVNTVKTWLRRSMLEIRECLGLA